MPRPAVSSVVAVLLLVIGLFVGSVGYYALQGAPAVTTATTISTTTATTSTTKTATVTQQTTTTQFSLTTQLATTTLIVATTVTGSSTGGGVADVQTLVVSCTAAEGPAPPETCSLILVNYGPATVGVASSCSLTLGGKTYAGTTSAQPTIVADTSSGLNCVGPVTAGAYATPGSQVTGSVSLTNGGSALFSATAS